MPRRLLREPHVLAHELRTPLSILAGWYSLIRDGDITKAGHPQEWQSAIAACQAAIDRLNFIISQACDEAEALRWPSDTAGEQYGTRVFEEATEAIQRSRELLARYEERRRKRAADRDPASLPERRGARRTRQPTATR
jgi:signal transduction histidine kinase